jgi:predicted DsbA family dithiol-disulfide isomerase
MRRLEEEFGEQVRLDWRSFLLRPRPRVRPADLEEFRVYTESWRRVAADPDSGSFRVWQGDAGPPSHSIPPHLVAKAAATLGDGEFRRMRDRLFVAYFSENRDITDDATLRALWDEVDLPAADFERSQEPALLRETLMQYQEAKDVGATGVPAVMLEGNSAVIVGAHPLELYQRWVRRTLAAREAGSES